MIRKFLALALIMAGTLPVLHAQDLQQGRVKQPFNGGWTFRKDPKLNPSDTSWQEVKIPHTYNNVDMQKGNDFYDGDAYYRNSYFLPEKNKDKRTFIRFEGVGAVATLYVNGRKVGEHKGAYAAFIFELTHLLKPGQKNDILVKTSNKARPDVIPINHRLFGVYGGIYRPVSIITTNKVNITATDYASPGIYIEQGDVDASKARIKVTAKLENKLVAPKNIKAVTAIKDMEGKVVSIQEKMVRVLPQGFTPVEMQFNLDHPHLWNGLDDPYLYGVTVSLYDGQHLLDEITQPLGVRDFKIVEGKGFYLNGRPYRLRGVCRHQEWWGYGSALSNEQHASDLAMIKEVGANSIRFAHYQQADYIYAKCDSIGFITWAEIPFVNAVSGQEGENAKLQLTELIRQQYNHPSIYVWGMHNEVYSKTPDEFVPVMTRQLNDLAKTLDPHRYTVSTSGYGEMDRPSNLATDIQAMNQYHGWYGGKITDVGAWLDGIEQQYPTYKTVFSEYGAEANIDQHEYSDRLKGNPNADFYPEDYQTKYHRIHWGAIAQHPYLVASYLWNMFDFAVPSAHGGGVAARNMKGIVTFDRKVKKDAFYWYKANWNPAPMVYIAGRRIHEMKERQRDVNVFSNLETVTLYVNKRKVAPAKIGYTKADFIFENVKFRKGKNTIVAKGIKDGKLFEDEIIWIVK